MARKITYAIDAALNFKILGFATGAYNCTCSICKEKFVGDKRAFQCLRCAIESVESKLQSAPPTNIESPKLLCPKCGSHVIHYSYLDKDNWCDDCHFRWEK